MAIAGGVADREDVGRAAAQLAVDADAVGDRQAGLGGEFDIGNHADADDQHARGDALARRRDDRADMPVVALDAADRRAQHHPHARGGKPPGDMRGDGGRDDPREQPVLRLDHRDAAAAGGQRRGDLQADEPAAQNDDVLDGRGKRADGARVGDGAQRQHAGERPAFDGKLAWPRAGGEDRLVEGEAGSGREVQPACRGIETHRAFAKQKIDAGAGVEGVGAQDLRPCVDILDEGLRQRRLVVGKLGLVADQPDGAVITLLAQARRSLHARMTRTDDDDAVLHDLPQLTPRRAIGMSRSGAARRVRVAS